MSNQILAYFEIDIERDKRDRFPIVVALAIILIISVARLVATLAFGAASVAGSTPAALIAAAVSAYCLILTLRNITGPARLMLPLTALIAIDLVLLTSGVGLRSPLGLGFPLSILLGGLMLGRRGGMLLSMLSLISVALIGFLPLAGITPVAEGATVALLDVIAGLVFIAAIGGLYWLIMRWLYQSIRQAQLNEQRQNEAFEELRSLQAGLEARIASSTEQLQQRGRALSAVAEIARDITSIQDPDQLLQTAVELIRDRFAFYHVGIFLIDDTGSYAVLRAATGEAGRLLVANHHQLKVGETGMVGFTAATGQARIALDVGADAVHFRNPLLPYTRSEMALPLKIGGRRIIGALDVQSMEQNAFGQEDLEVLQVLADQLTIAIENSRLVQRLETTLHEVTLLYQGQMADTSQAFARRRQTAFEYDRVKISPVKHILPASVLETLREGKPLVLSAKQLKALKMDEHSQSLLLVPLLLRDQIIGVIGLEQVEEGREWQADEIVIAQTIAGQAAITLENARLLEVSQQRALQERALGEISAKISENIRMENVLRTTAQELSRVLSGSEVLIQLQSAIAEAERRTP